MIRGLIGNRFARFLISGGLNTAITYGVYLVFLMVMPYKYSYTVSCLVGIAFAYVMNRFFVFERHQGLKSFALLPLIYLLQYLIGLGVLWFLVDKLGVSEVIAPLAVVLVTVPITYIMSKLAF